jgi:hypothetical protein
MFFLNKERLDESRLQDCREFQILALGPWQSIVNCFRLVRHEWER